MSDLLPRRGFLRQLAALPLVGGGVTLIGQPTAVAEPITRGLLAQYWNWLFYERRLLCIEMAGDCRDRKRWLEACGGRVDFIINDASDQVAMMDPRVWPADAAGPGARWPEFHFPHPGNWTDVPKPSSRAAVVMAASGFDWRPEVDR